MVVYINAHIRKKHISGKNIVAFSMKYLDSAIMYYNYGETTLKIAKIAYVKITHACIQDFTKVLYP